MLTLCLCLLLAAPAADPIVLTLDEVLVTAERVPHQVRDVAASVSIVTADDIERSGARTITDALTHLPGVFVQRTGQFGRTDIEIRGVGDRGARVAVLVDGRPEKMPIYGCVVTHTLPVNNVERIEVVRGPLSVLYGSDAMGGVVNIITRRASKPFEAGARFSYGSFNTWQGRLSAGTRQGRWNLLFSADKAVSDGHLPNSRYDGNDLSLRAGVDLARVFTLDFTGKYFTGVKHEPKRATDPDSVVAGGWNRYDRGGLDLTASLARLPVQGFLQLYRTFGEHEFDPVDGWHSTDRTNGAVLHLHRRVAAGNLLQGGVEFKHMSSSRVKLDTVPWTRSQFGVFVQDEHRLGPVTANAGLRYELDAISGGIFAPKTGAVLRLPGRVNLRAGVNRGFRFAPLNNTSVFPPKNAGLLPEVSWNYEAGASWEALTGITLDAAGFILNGENLIELGRNDNPPPPMQFRNQGSFRFKGVEFGADARVGRFRGNLSGTVTDHGANTRARPGLKLDASVGADYDRFSLDLLGRAVGDYYAADSARSPIASYATADVRAGARLLPYLRLSAAVENVLDRRYVTFADLPGTGAGLYEQPGRSFTVGLDVGIP